MKEKKTKIRVVVGIAAGVVVVAAVAFLAYLSHRHYKETIISQTQQQLLMNARSIAIGIEEYIEEHLHVLQVVSRNPSIQERTFNRIVEPQATTHCVCEDLYEAHKEHVDALTILDARGIMLRRHPRLEERIGKNHTDKPGVAYVLREKMSHVSEVFYNNLGQLAISASEPIFHHGAFAGMVRWMIQIDRISKGFIETIGLARKGGVWMFDDRGMILTHPRKELIGTSVLDAVRETHEDRGQVLDEHGWEEHIREQHDYLNQVRLEEQGCGIFVDCITETKELVAYTKVVVGDRAWNLITALPYSEIAGPIYKHARNTFGLAGVVILVFGLGGSILFRGQKRRAELESATRYLKRVASTAEALKQSQQKLEGIVGSVSDHMIRM